MGPRAALDRCGKSRPQLDSISRPSRAWPVAIQTEISRPTINFCESGLKIGDNKTYVLNCTFFFYKFFLILPTHFLTANDVSYVEIHGQMYACNYSLSALTHCSLYVPACILPTFRPNFSEVVRLEQAWPILYSVTKQYVG